MNPLNLGNVQTILAIGAHPDDIEIGCGGTLLRLIEEHPGLSVHWLVLSGSSDRKREAQAGAARFLEGTANRQVSVASFRDSFFPAQYEDIKEFFHEYEKSVSPDLIFTHRRSDEHQDHRLLGELTWNTFRDHLILEYEIPKFEGDLGQPNVFVPLERSICEEKISALLSVFPTQSARDWFDEETFWALLRMRGVESNTRYAEAFYARKMVV